MEGESDTVELYVFGLRTVVPKPVSARANLNWTWYHFLNNVCGVKVGPESLVQACTTSYSAVTKRGWAADLSEQIRDFVDKFSLKRDKYSVRLMMKLTPNSNVGQSSDGTVTVDESDLFNSDSSAVDATSIHQRESARRTRSRVSSNVTEAVYISSSNTVEMKDQNPIDGEMNMPFEYATDQDNVNPLQMDDEMSDEVLESRQSRPARRARHSKRESGTQKGELKGLIKSRIRKLGNPFLLKVQKEINKLQRNQIWYRNVQYAPLSSYLLQEVFAEKE